MRNYRLARPPQALRRSTVHLDNVALVPASLLPFKAEWQAIANGLPHGGALIVMPSPSKQQQIARSVAGWLMVKGWPVRLLELSAVQQVTLPKVI